MNKIKLLYDVVKTMKDKEVFTGVVNVEVQKDQARIFSLKNEFEKNIITRQVKANICTALDYEGKKVNHQSSTEFIMPCPSASKHHELITHLHQHHTANCGGMKGKLTKLAFAFSILNSLQVEEQGNKTIVISLNANDIPVEMKELIQEKMSHAGMCHHHGGHGFMKEFCTMEKSSFTVNMFINKNYEVEKLIVNLDGAQKDEQNEQHELKAIAELSFVW